MNSTFACFTSLKQSCFLTSEKSIYHLWEINLSLVKKRTQRVAVWWNSVYAQGKFQRLYRKSASNLPHLPQSATNLPHIYPPVYQNDNACLWQIGRFFREKPIRTRARMVNVNTKFELWIVLRPRIERIERIEWTNVIYNLTIYNLRFIYGGFYKLGLNCS